MAAVAQLKERGVTTRLLLRGGLAPFGGEVLDFAQQRGLGVAPLSTRIEDVAALAKTLRDNADADIWNVTAFLPDDLLPVLYASATATLANSGHEPFGLVAVAEIGRAHV